MKNFIKLSFAFFFLASLGACIQDDFVEDYVAPRIVINNPIDSLEEGTTFQFEIMAFDHVGREFSDPGANWTSSNPSIVEIDQNGLATAIVEGASTITVEMNAFDVTTTDEFILNVGEKTVIPVVITRTGIVNTTSSYPLTGDFELIDNNGDITLNLADNYVADPNLPGLYVYLSNNSESFADAFEISEVTIFQGAHSYDLPDTIGVYDYQYLLYFCKPFVAKVGHGEISF